MKLVEEENQIRLLVSVSDSGIGMTPEQLSRIFKPFVQADISVTRNFGGTGLGLTISKRIVNALGGEIRVASEFGKGSTFEFTIDIGDVSNQESITMEQYQRYLAIPEDSRSKITKLRRAIFWSLTMAKPTENWCVWLWNGLAAACGKLKMDKQAVI